MNPESQTIQLIPSHRKRIRPLPAAAEAGWLLLLFAAATVLLVVGSAKVGFQGKDERRYAQVGREIAPGSSAVVMHYLGGLYPDKPPLFFWMEAASYRLLGRSDPFATRLPLIVMSLAGLALAYLLMRQLEGSRVALIGTAMLMFSFRYFWESKQVRLDVPMCAFTWGAFWASTRLLFPHEGRAPGGAAWAWLAWTMTALAVLAKGPGAIVWLGTLLVYAAVTRRYEPLRRHHIWMGLVWLIAIVALWFVPAATMGGRDYYETMLKVHVVERFAGVVRHAQPIVYFLYKLPTDALPMGLLIPVSLWWAWRQRNRPDGGRTLFVICWFLFGLIFFSIPHGKRGQYILPIYPAVALLAARFVVAGFRSRRAHRLLVGHTWLIALLLLLCVPAIILLLIFAPEEFPVTPPARYVIGTLAALTLGGGGIGWLLKKHRLKLALASAAATVYLCYLLLFVDYMPVVHNDRVPRQIAATLNKRIAAGEAVAFMNLDSAASLYMTKQPQWILTPEQARGFMAHEDQRWLLTSAGELKPGKDPGWPVREQWEEHRGQGAVVLLSNRVLSLLPEVLYESPKQ